jgi:hypothetical protein
VTFPFSTFISASRQGPPHRIFPATVGPLGLSDLHHDRNENDQQDDYDGPKDYAINLRLEELLKTLHFFLISLTVPSREPRRVLASGRGSLARRNRGERGAATTTSPRKRVFRVIGTGGSLGAASLPHTGPYPGFDGLSGLQHRDGLDGVTVRSGPSILGEHGFSFVKDFCSLTLAQNATVDEHANGGDKNCERGIAGARAGISVGRTRPAGELIRTTNTATYRRAAIISRGEPGFCGLIRPSAGPTGA